MTIIQNRCNRLVSQLFFFLSVYCFSFPFTTSSQALSDSTEFSHGTERSKTDAFIKKKQPSSMCECCKSVVKPVEGKVILALRQGKSLLTSTTGPVLTFPTHYILQHSVELGDLPNYLCVRFFHFINSSICLFQHCDYYHFGAPKLPSRRSSPPLSPLLSRHYNCPPCFPFPVPHAGQMIIWEFRELEKNASSRFICLYVLSRPPQSRSSENKISSGHCKEDTHP